MDSLGFNALDWIFVGVILISSLMGFASGAVAQIGTLVAMFGGFLAARFLSAPLATILIGFLEHEPLALAVSYMTIFIGVGIIVKILFGLLHFFVERVKLKLANRVMGMTLGLVKGVGIVILLSTVLYYYSSQRLENLFAKSRLAPYVLKFYPFVKARIQGQETDIKARMKKAIEDIKNRVLQEAEQKNETSSEK